MFSSTDTVPAIHLDASWDHGVLSDEDTAWLLQQQENTDLSNDWLSGLNFDDLDTDMEVDVQQIQYQSSPRSVADIDSLDCLDVAITKTSELLPKQELRKHKNRQSAVRSRQRTRERMDQLEEMAIALAAKNQQLRHTLNLLHYHRLHQQQQHHQLQLQQPMYQQMDTTTFGGMGTQVLMPHTTTTEVTTAFGQKRVF